jgi:hypothetical protein
VMLLLQHEPSLSQAFKHPGVEPVLLMWSVPVQQFPRRAGAP